MVCENCHEPIYVMKEHRENILNKYILIEHYWSDGSSKKKIILFNKLIDYIKENENLEIFRELKNQIYEETIVTCDNCGHGNKMSYSLNITNEFCSYIDKYIDFVIDNIVTKYTAKNSSDFSIYINESNVDILFENLPHSYKNDWYLLKKLFYVSNILPIPIERGGVGSEILEWVLEQFKVEVFGIVLGLIITGGLTQIKGLLMSFNIKNKIKKRIKSGGEYWKDISLDDLKQYISIPKEYKGSKEEIIEKILENKFEEYKNAMIEKLR